MSHHNPIYVEYFNINKNSEWVVRRLQMVKEGLFVITCLNVRTNRERTAILKEIE